MAEPLEQLREAGTTALECSRKLYEIGSQLLDETENTEDEPEALNSVEMIQEAAHEIRRQGLWLRGEADVRSQ